MKRRSEDRNRLAHIKTLHDKSGTAEQSEDHAFLWCLDNWANIWEKHNWKPFHTKQKVSFKPIIDLTAKDKIIQHLDDNIE